MIAKSNSSNEDDGPTIEATAPGTYVAVCRGVIGVGTHKTGFRNKDTNEEEWANQVVLMFELPTERIEINGKDRPRGQNSFATTISLGKKANLRRKFIEPWRGKEFTAEEAAEGFDLQVLLGQNCLMSVINKTVTKDGVKKTYANIGGILPLVKGTPTHEPENEVIYYEIDSSMVIPEATPEWLKIKIFESREMRGHSKDDETGQQNHAPEEVMASERVNEQMVNEEFRTSDKHDDIVF